MYNIDNNQIIVHDLSDFNIKHILECGQVFRYKDMGTHYMLFAGENVAYITKQMCDSDTKQQIKIISNNPTFFVNYFDIAKNYGIIKYDLLSLAKDTSLDLLINAINFGYGIRILKQDLFETIISFIISANNHIPRIKSIIEKLCVLAGQKIDVSASLTSHISAEFGTSIRAETVAETEYTKFKSPTYYYAFPTMQSIASLSEQQLKDIGAGYRAPYILQTANTLAVDKTFAYENLNALSTKELEKKLMLLKGVGKKVAHCIMLFGLSRWEVFPTDTHILQLYKSNFADNSAEKNQHENIKTTDPNKIEQFFTNKFKQYSGLVQQYLFYYKLMRYKQ
ncbi:MAG: hypothetical protein FWB72_06810 [Firmicutes bacterium]|nr:hypothetical protein [Bacillota bacterium]